MRKQVGPNNEKSVRKPTYAELEERVRQLESELQIDGCSEDMPLLEEDKQPVVARLMRRMMDNVPDLIWAKDMEDRFLYVNQGMCDKLLRCDSLKEARGETDLFFAERERASGHEHTFGEVCVNSDQVVKKTLKTGRFLEYGLVRGEYLVLDVHKAPLFNCSGEMVGTVGCGRDVTKEKGAEAALDKARQALRSIASDIDGIAIQGYDEKRRVTLWNHTSEKLYGYTPDEAMGRLLEDLIIPDEIRRNVIHAHRRWLVYDEKIPSGELVLKNKAGEDVHVYSSHTLQKTGAGKEMFCLDVDLTPIRRAEEEKRILSEQLEKAQKMEAIGTLAGGIAHDFNNILAAITGYAELAEMEVPEESRAAYDIEMLLQAADRARELVKQILTFSRKAPQGMKPIRVQAVVDEAMNMMRSSLPSTIDIETSFDGDRDLILADPTGIHQVVVNLCTNALHAMKNQKGSLKVTLSRQVVDSDRAGFEGGEESKPYIVLSVEDNGCGMDDLTQKQMFEPYFTTKERGEGTGLGLAMVHGIVKRGCGFIEVESTVGKGTMFHVYLPVLEQKLPEKAKKDENVALPMGNEHILFVDDEQAICDIVTLLLGRLGYRVTACNSSVEALKFFTAEPAGFDLVISDQTMPDLTGVELTSAILALRPDMSIILCTGYTSTITREDALDMGIKRFVEKPISRRLLAESVRSVLDEREGQ